MEGQKVDPTIVTAVTPGCEFPGPRQRKDPTQEESTTADVENSRH
tara:strand:- start:1855 stop:1989 length:135 start_codon:yes stop_codon:yes gene_type:complete